MQLIVGTFLVQAVFLLFFVYITVVSEQRGAEARSRQRIVLQLDRLAAACADPLAAGDTEALRKVLELSRIAPTIEAARVTDLAGRTIAVSHNGVDSGLDAYEAEVLSGAPRQQTFKIKNGQMEAVTPILRDGRPVALLWLEPNHAISLGTVNTVVRVSLTYGGFALLANILPIFVIVQTMTRPLHKLSTATQRLISNPDLNAGFPLPVTARNEAGELTASFNSMVRDLDKQRSGLLETLALLDSMLANAPIGFAFFDSELRYVRLNEFVAGMNGRAIEDHLGRTGSELYPGAMSAEMETHLAHVLATGTAVRDVEIAGEMPNAAGMRRSWLMHFYPVRTQQHTIRWVGVVVVEITERLQAEEVLRRTEKLAAAGRLAASIAHEINNPLEAVTNLLYLLRTHKPMDEGASELIAMAEAELARVSEITQQTLRFYRQPTAPGPASAGEVMRSVVSLYQSRIQSSGVTVFKTFRGEPTVFGFGGELRQLFANLIGNAIDAMPGGGTLALRARPGHGRGADGEWGSGVRISVADSGIGMSAETRRRIFEAFFTTKQATGTGLGLWVSEEIVRKHSGCMRVRSRQGKDSGTIFMMFFPARRLENAAAPVQREDQKMTASA